MNYLFPHGSRKHKRSYLSGLPMPFMPPMLGQQMMMPPMGMAPPMLQMPSLSGPRMMMSPAMLQMPPMSFGPNSMLRPQLMPQRQFQLYDPITGKMGPSVGPFGNITTKTYNNNNVAVDITGTNNDIDKVLAMMNGSLNPGMPQVDDDSLYRDIIFDANGDIDYVAITGNPSAQARAQVQAQVPLPGQIVNPNQSNAPIQNNWAYFQNQLNPGKILLSRPGIKEFYSGSGVLLIEKEYRGKGPMVVLAQSTENPYMFQDFGGSIDNKHFPPGMNTLRQNAHKELQEESSNLFSFGNSAKDLDIPVNNIYKYVDIINPVDGSLYRCYCQFFYYPQYDLRSINGQIITEVKLEQYFLENKNKIAQIPKLPGEYKETVQITRFNFMELLPLLRTTSGAGYIQCADVNGNICIISERTTACMRALVENANQYEVLSKNNLIAKFTGNVSLGPVTGLTKFVLG